MLIEAALAGLGVALVPQLYVEAELQEGRLIAPWPAGRTVSKTFSLVLPEPIGLSGETVRKFVSWVTEEAKTARSAT